MGFYYKLKERDQFRRDALGFLSESWPLGASAESAAAGLQTLRASLLGLRAGDVVTNIVVCLDVAAAGTAGVVNVALYDTAGARLASSGDVAASFTSTGVKQLALTSPYTVTADGGYYAALLITTAWGTTQPGFLQSTQAAGIGTALSGKARAAAIQTGQASLPSTATFADTASAYWFAVN